MHTVFPGEGPRAVGMVSGCRQADRTEQLGLTCPPSAALVPYSRSSPHFPEESEDPATWERGPGQTDPSSLWPSRGSAGLGRAPGPGSLGSSSPGWGPRESFLSEAAVPTAPGQRAAVLSPWRVWVGKSAPAPGVCCSQAANKRLRCLAVSCLPHGATAPCLGGDRLPASCGPWPLAAPRPLCRCPPLPRHQGILAE